MQMLWPETVFMLSPHAKAIYDPELVLDFLDTQYAFTGASAQIMSAALPYLDGSKTLREIETRTGVLLDRLSAVLGVFENWELTNITPMLNARSTGEFLAYYYPLCDYWAKYIFCCPFWENMLTGQSTREQVLGWGIEFYHRTLGADEHNDTAVRYCQDSEIREWLKDHFREEFGHGTIFLQGLVDSGLQREEVINSTPLLSTRALIEYFNKLAIAHTTAYLGCYGVMHSPRVGQTKERINEQFDLLVGHYPFASDALNAIRRHALLDIDLDHDEIILEKLARREKVFSHDVSIRILKAAFGTVKAFCEYFGGINDYYRRQDVQILQS